MFRKMITLITFPATPVLSIVLLGIADSLLRSSGADFLHFLLCLILTVVAVVSTLVNIASYSKVMKAVSLTLSLIGVMFMFTEFKVSASEPHSANSYQPVSTSTVSFTGSSWNSSGSLFDDRCNFCNDSKKCHVCNGKGDFYCHGTYCISGECTSCDGSGLYDHGTYLSRCLTCSGDGECDICDGTNRYDCTLCRGKGKCTHCR